MGSGQYGAVYKVQRRNMSPSEPTFYAAKKLFIKNTDQKNEEKIIKSMPEGDQQRILEILENDKTLSVRKLKAGTYKTFIREVDILRQLPPHPNVVRLIEILNQPVTDRLRDSKEVPDRFTEYLIFEFAEHELGSVLASKIKFEDKHAKCIIKQLLEGLVHLERNKVLHRDLKPSNILLNKHGVLKIIDFGNARYADCSHMQADKQQYTPRVTTPLYQAPELFFRDRLYDSKIDVWAAGCILFELLTLQPLFPVSSGEAGILFGMFQVIGIPDETSSAEQQQVVQAYK